MYFFFELGIQGSKTGELPIQVNTKQVGYLESLCNYLLKILCLQFDFDFQKENFLYLQKNFK